jgi:hypothetical protein
MQNLTFQVTRTLLALTFACSGTPCQTAGARPFHVSDGQISEAFVAEAFAPRPALVPLRTRNDPFSRLCQWVKGDWGYRERSTVLSMSFGLPPSGTGGSSKGRSSDEEIFQGLPAAASVLTSDRRKILTLLERLIAENTENDYKLALKRHRRALRKMTASELTTEFRRLLANYPGHFEVSRLPANPTVRHWLQSDYHLTDSPRKVAQAIMSSGAYRDLPDVVGEEKTMYRQEVQKWLMEAAFVIEVFNRWMRWEAKAQ